MFMHPGFFYGVFLILAFTCFVIDGFHISKVKVNWNFQSLGFACIVGALLIPFLI